MANVNEAPEDVRIDLLLDVAPISDQSCPVKPSVRMKRFRMELLSISTCKSGFKLHKLDSETRGSPLQ